MTETEPDALATKLTLTIGSLAQQKAVLRDELEKVHAKFLTGGFSRGGGWTDLPGLVAACTDDVSRSVLDLELQGWAAALLGEVDAAATTATEFLESGWIVLVEEGKPSKVVLRFAVGDVSDPDTGIERMEQLIVDLRILGFRVSSMTWLIRDDADEFWDTEFLNRMSNAVRGPVSLSDDGLGFHVDP